MSISSRGALSARGSLRSVQRVIHIDPLARGQLAVCTRGLTKRFGDRTVVDGLDLDIPKGSVCGFVGPNGAGKTTTIRMLLGLIRPSAGSGTVLNGNLDKPETCLHEVGALIESPAFYPQLTGRNNLLALARLGGIDSDTIAPILERVGLLHRSGDSYRSYSNATTGFARAVVLSGLYLAGVAVVTASAFTRRDVTA